MFAWYNMVTQAGIANI